jgi:hypothetical protein
MIIISLYSTTSDYLYYICIIWFCYNNIEVLVPSTSTKLKYQEFEQDNCKGIWTGYLPRNFKNHSRQFSTCKSNLKKITGTYTSTSLQKYWIDILPGTAL